MISVWVLPPPNMEFSRITAGWSAALPCLRWSKMPVATRRMAGVAWVPAKKSAAEAAFPISPCNALWRLPAAGRPYSHNEILASGHSVAGGHICAASRGPGEIVRDIYSCARQTPSQGNLRPFYDGSDFRTSVASPAAGNEHSPEIRPVTRKMPDSALWLARQRTIRGGKPGCGNRRARDCYPSPIG